MAPISDMVKFFTLCPKASVKSNNFIHHQCLTIKNGKLVPRDEHNIQRYKFNYQYRTFAEGTGTTKDPGKEEQIEKIKMPGFVHPQTQNEEGYFTQKAHQQLEELKKKLEKPAIENTEKKD